MIHQVKGKNLREALERAREQIGQEAMVVTHRSSSDGVTLAVTPSAPRDPIALERLRLEARQMLGEGARKRRGPGCADVERNMEASGTSPIVIQRVCERVEANLETGHHPLDLAAAEIGRLFPVARAKRSEGRARILCFVGQTGVGKTSTLGKLALRLAQSGRRIALACIDTSCAPALERIGEHLGVPVYAGKELEELMTELRGESPYDVVLLDTPGELSRDVWHIRRLTYGVRRAELDVDVDTYVVLSSLTSRGALRSATRTVRPLAPAGCVITKLDECDAPAPVLEHALRSKLPIAFLSNGSRLVSDFHRPTPDRFADLLLRGRIVR